MGFAGMFTRLDTDFTALVNATAAVHVTDKYRKADLVREASMLQVSPLLEYELFPLNHYGLNIWASKL